MSRQGVTTILFLAGEGAGAAVGGSSACFLFALGFLLLVTGIVIVFIIDLARQNTCGVAAVTAKYQYSSNDKQLWLRSDRIHIRKI